MKAAFRLWRRSAALGRPVTRWCRRHPLHGWVALAALLGVLFVHHHVVVSARQAATYEYLTCKTALNADTLLYAGFTSGVLRSPGFPSDPGLFEHRGQRTIAFMTFTLPVWFMAVHGLLAGGDLDLAYRICAFSGIFLAALVLYPLLRATAVSWWHAAFLLFVVFLFSAYLRPYALTHPDAVAAWIRRLGVSGTFFNDFQQPHNIQVTFLFYALFVTSLWWLLAKPQEPRRIVLAAIGLAGAGYSYLYYIPQAAMIVVLIGIVLVVSGRRGALGSLALACALAAVGLIPLLVEAWQHLQSPLSADYAARFGSGLDPPTLAGVPALLVASGLYVGAKILTRSWTDGAMLIAANAVGVAIVVTAAALLSIDVQTGHLLARSFYPMCGLLLADLAYTAWLAIPGAVACLRRRWREFTCRASPWRPGLDVAAAAVMVGLVGFHLHSIEAQASNVTGYATLEPDTAALLEWVRRHAEDDDVFLTSDGELIRLLPARAGVWVFLTVGTTSVAGHDELVDRLAWGYRLLGIDEAELERRLGSPPGARTAFAIDIMNRWTLDYDRYNDVEWCYLHFGRTFWHSPHRLPQNLGPDEDGPRAEILAGTLSEYIPLEDRREIVGRLRECGQLPVTDCPYRVTYVLSSPYDRRGALDRDGMALEWLTKIETFGRYDVLRVTR